MTNPEVTGGLIELPKDARDFSVGAVFDLPPLSELPSTFIVGAPTVKNQQGSDFCAAESSCSLSEIHEEVELCPEWVFAVAKDMDGQVDGFGTDLRTICKVHTKYGAIEAKDAPYSLEKGSGVDFLRRLDNWPTKLFTKALVHKKGSYFAVTDSDTDDFDTIRRTMWKFRNEKCGVLFGVRWSWSLSDVYMKTIGNGTGHALAMLGWTTQADGEVYMYIQNSYGPEAGLGGRHYFSRDVINAFSDRFGCYVLLDMPKEKAQYLVDTGTKQGDNWLVSLFKAIKNFLWPNSGNAGSVKA